MTTVLKAERTAAWQSDSLEITVDADVWGNLIAKEVHEHVLESIKAGQDPAGGGQKPLQAGSSRAKRANAGKRPRARGFTEHAIFTNSIIMRKLKASKKKAEFMITTDKPGVFSDWLIDEGGRGVDYFPIKGRVDKIVEAAAKKLLDKAAK